MSAESIRENAIRKVIQELIVTDLQKLIGRIDILDERMSSVKNELKSDIIRLDEKIDSFRNELKSDISHLESEVKKEIEHLNEKVDLMNKFNERLFNLVQPAGQK